MPDTLRLAGALVAPHSHDDLLLSVHESGTPVVAAVSVFDFGLGFDVTEGPVGEADIALDLTEAVWTFAQGGFRFRAVGGPLLYTGASGDDLFLTGDLDVSGVAAVGSWADIDGGGRQALRLWHNTGDLGPMLMGAGADVRMVCNTAVAGFAYGVRGEIAFTGSAQSYIAGLLFNAIQGGSATAAWLHGIMVSLISYAGYGAVTSSKGLEVTPDYQGNKPSTFWGVHIKGHSGLATAYGVQVGDLTGATIRLLEMGPSTPYLRLVGGAAPGGFCTNLYLAEGATPTLRQVQWKAGNALGAGDKVMVLV